MTHDPKAVEIVARWAWGEDWRDGLHPGHENMQRAKVDAILDAITPIIVAAEREACAALCDDACHFDTQRHLWVSDDCVEIAAAIRARKP